MKRGSRADRSRRPEEAIGPGGRPDQKETRTSRDAFTYIVGGKAGEGVKKAGSTAANLFAAMETQLRLGSVTAAPKVL